MGGHSHSIHTDSKRSHQTSSVRGERIDLKYTHEIKYFDYETEIEELKKYLDDN